MPVSTRQTAKPTQQSKLNFGSTKSTAHLSAKDINAKADSKSKYHGATVVVHSNAPPPDEDLEPEEKTEDSETKEAIGGLDAIVENENAKPETAEVIPADDTTVTTKDITEPSNEDVKAEPYQEQLVSKPVVESSTLLEGPIQQAYKVTEKDIKSYYQGIQDARIVKTVHQEDLTEYEKILRHFDHSIQYGPCVGLTRFKRWNRANRFKQNPPIEVLAVLLKSELGEGVEVDPPKGWKPATASAKTGVGAVAQVDRLLATRAE